MDTTIKNKFDGISSLISNTPLLDIELKYKGECRHVYAKAEFYNLTGSIKDRVAFHILKKAYENGNLKPSDVIAEATSGNTGISFSALGSYLGHKVVIYMPDWMSLERINLIKSFGAEVRLVSREEGGFLGSIKKTEELFAKGGVFLPCQFSNDDNTEAHYLTTGKEIISQLAKIGKTPDGVVAGVGTGGTIMGIGKRFKEEFPNSKVYPLEPLSSPTLSTGHRVGSHRIQGISDEFIPAIVKLDKLDDVIAVDDGDAIVMARMLTQKLGLGVGISSGANFIGALIAQEKLGKNATIATVFSDDNKKYLSTDYAREQEMKPSYYSKDVELISVNSVLCDK
ncbi:MAG: PLP-dependent cysteine synthase family protein [Clostridia bacterium]